MNLDSRWKALRPHPIRRNAGNTVRARAALRRVVLALTIVALALVPPLVAAQAYPDRLIRVVLGVPAGSGSDLSARLVAAALEPELGQRVIVDNRPGADGIIAVRQVTTAPADGYTLLYALGSQIVINPATFATLPYDPRHDLAPISLVSRQPLMVAVHPSLPVRTLKELVDYTRAHPGTVNYGAGTSTFMLATEALKQRTGADMLHIPFNGNGPAVTALVAGTVQVTVAATLGAMGHVQSGAMRVLAVSGNKRLAQMPDVPSFAELGLDEDVPVWTALYAPAGTPREVIDRLNAAVVRVLNAPAMRDRFVANADLAVTSTPDEMAAIAARDTVRVEALVKRIGFVPR